MKAFKEFPTQQKFQATQPQPRDWAGWPGAAERVHMTVRSAVELLPEACRLKGDCFLMLAETNPADKRDRKRRLTEKCNSFAEEFSKARIPDTSATAGRPSDARVQQLPAPELRSALPASPVDGPSRFDVARQRGGKQVLPPGSAAYAPAPPTGWNGQGQRPGGGSPVSAAPYSSAAAQRLRAMGIPKHSTDNTVRRTAP